MTAETGGPLRFATFLAPNMLPVYRFLADQIAHRLGRPVQLVVGSSLDQFDQGEGDRYAGRPIYYSDVIVRHDSPISCLEELEGRSWAYNEPASHSGHTITLYSLVRRGIRPGFLGRVVEAGFHQRAIRLVATGAAAAIDSQVLAIERRDHPQLADRLRIIDTFGPSTIQPVVAARRLPEQLKDGVRELLVGLGDDASARPVLDHGFIQASPRSTTPAMTISAPCWPPSRPPGGPA
jgi:ABC-type phosphate/phosphonate transport system substrate-binding protein